jgi:hypothetical protein
VVNTKLFGAIVLVGASLGACRSGILGPPDLSAATDLASRDLATTTDLATPAVDLAHSDLQPCCANDPTADLSGCIPINCILL